MTKDTGIVKSSAVLQKEEELKELQKKYKKLTKSLHKQRSDLQVMKDQIVNMQQKVATQVFTKMELLHELRAEIVVILQALKKSKKISRDEKRLVKEMLADFEDAEADFQPPPRPDFTEQEAHEQQRAKSPHEFLFDHFRQETSPEESQQIRKIFLRLANQFHPDKAKSPKEAELFHTLMQQLNEAYKRGDLGALLQIESQYASGVLTPPDYESGVADFLDREIQRLQTEIQLVESQLSRLKLENNSIKKSDLGAVFKQQKRMSSQGIDPIAEMTEDLDESYRNMLFLRDNMQKFLETGKMPEEFLRYLEQQQSPEEMLLQELMNRISQMEDDQDDDLFAPRRKSRKKSR